MNKNLYVEFLASLYKQNKMQKPNEDNNKMYSSNNSLSINQENFNFPSFKKENSSTNNASFSHQEENSELDDLM